MRRNDLHGCLCACGRPGPLCAASAGWPVAGLTPHKREPQQATAAWRSGCEIAAVYKNRRPCCSLCERALRSFGSVFAGQLHVQQGIGVPLFVVVGPFIHPEAHVLIKASGLRVLLVHGQPRDGIVFDAVAEQARPQPLAPLRRGDEQHLQNAVLDAHKCDRPACLVLGCQQMGDPVQSLRHIRLYGANLAVRKKPMLMYSEFLNFQNQK